MCSRSCMYMCAHLCVHVLLTCVPACADPVIHVYALTRLLTPAHSCAVIHTCTCTHTPVTPSSLLCKQTVFQNVPFPPVVMICGSVYNLHHRTGELVWGPGLCRPQRLFWDAPTTHSGRDRADSCPCSPGALHTHLLQNELT